MSELLESSAATQYGEAWLVGAVPENGFADLRVEIHLFSVAVLRKQKHIELPSPQCSSSVRSSRSTVLVAVIRQVVNRDKSQKYVLILISGSLTKANENDLQQYS